MNILLCDINGWSVSIFVLNLKLYVDFPSKNVKCTSESAMIIYIIIIIIFHLNEQHFFVKLRYDDHAFLFFFLVYTNNTKSRVKNY